MVSPQGLAVQLICSCDEIPDEGVEVLVLRGLLTATTSLTFTLHGQALLLAVRTCYNIHLMSRSEVNQTTAKATLTQMLNVVFQRMEAGSVKIPVSVCEEQHIVVCSPVRRRKPRTQLCVGVGGCVRQQILAADVCANCCSRLQATRLKGGELSTERGGGAFGSARLQVTLHAVLRCAVLLADR